MTNERDEFLETVDARFIGKNTIGNDGRIEVSFSDAFDRNESDCFEVLRLYVTGQVPGESVALYLTRERTAQLRDALSRALQVFE